MIAFGVVVFQQLGQRSPQRALREQNQFRKAFLI